MTGTHFTVVHKGYRKDGCEEDVSNLRAAQYVYGIGFLFFTADRKYLSHLGYTILDDVADH